MDVNNIAKVGKYILAMNAFKKKRQSSRSKVYYYEKLFYQRDFGAPGFLKWRGKKEKLRILIKKHLMAKIAAELKMHKLVMKTRKQLAEIKKEMPFNIVRDTDYIVGIRLLDSSFDEEEMDYGFIDLKRIEEIVLNSEIEQILLTNNKADYA